MKLKRTIKIPGREYKSENHQAERTKQYARISFLPNKVERRTEMLRPMIEEMTRTGVERWQWKFDCDRI
jgi:hypothetical protein